MRHILILACIALISACGSGSSTPVPSGGSGGSNTTLTGVFLDSAVDGIRYDAGTISGDTDSNGRFTYRAGDTIRFYIGGIVLGSAPAKPVMTPLDLVPGATDETNNVVTNILRFLQTIDADNNPNNGIQIAQAVLLAASGQTMNFNRSVADFEASEKPTIDVLMQNLLGTTRPLVSASQAQQHLRDTLASNVGGGVGNGDFGTLTLSGPDTAVIGQSFQATTSSEQPVFNVTGVSWSAGLGRLLTMIVAGDKLSDLTMVLLSPSDISQSYAYTLNCDLTPAACADISINLATRTVNFMNLSLPADTRDSALATAPLTLNGTLTWTQ